MQCIPRRMNACRLHLLLVGGTALAVQAVPPISTHFSVVWSVICLSVCHIRAPCLNRLMDLNVIWQVQYTCGVQWHIVLDRGLTPGGKGDLPPREGEICPTGEKEIWGSNLQPKHTIASFVLPPGEYKQNHLAYCYKLTHSVSACVFLSASVCLSVSVFLSA